MCNIEISSMNEVRDKRLIEINARTAWNDLFPTPH